MDYKYCKVVKIKNRNNKRSKLHLYLSNNKTKRPSYFYPTCGAVYIKGIQCEFIGDYGYDFEINDPEICKKCANRANKQANLINLYKPLAQMVQIIDYVKILDKLKS